MLHYKLVCSANQKIRLFSKGGAHLENERPFALHVRSLRKSYGDVIAVDDVSFDVERGSVFCMIGPNGAGKTTTIECIEGLRRPDSGSIRVAGLDPIEDRRELVGNIGVQLQEFGVPTRMKPHEALRMFGSMYAKSLPLSELSVELDLEDCLSKTYGTLSGGQKRRVNIALALVGDPEILLLDEPTTGLDPESRFRFWNYIKRKNSAGMTVVVTTHQMDEARDYCDVVMLINEGKKVMLGPPDRLIADMGLVSRVTLPRSAIEAKALEGLAGLESVIHVRGTESDCYVYGSEKVVGDVAEHLSKFGISSGVMTSRPANLEDVYFLAVGQEYLGGIQK